MDKIKITRLPNEEMCQFRHSDARQYRKKTECSSHVSHSTHEIESGHRTHLGEKHQNGKRWIGALNKLDTKYKGRVPRSSGPNGMCFGNGMRMLQFLTPFTAGS